MNIVKNLLKEWGIPVVIALIIAMIINKFIFFQISVPTESMFPTIKPGDRIVVTPVYNTANLKRGDVVVFYSEELKETLVKRLIGLPKDKVEVKNDGSVWINGEHTEQPYIFQSSNKEGNFSVPEGKFLFLGDNRPNSWDSRWWKNPYIDKSQIKGKARFTVYPFNRAGMLK